MRNLDPNFRESQKFALNELFLTKDIMLELKKYRGVMFDSTENWCKIWRKTDLYFQKWHERPLENFHMLKKIRISF